MKTYITILIMLFACTGNIRAAETEVLSKADADTIHKSLDLKEVVVKGRRVIHYADKDVWIVNNRLRRGAFTTVEMIGNIPGMDYDPATQKLTCMGFEKIKILMDGKEKEDGYIEELSHIRFKKVEVTMHPQGHYGDYDVLVNLISLSNYSGIEGSLRTAGRLNPAYYEKPSRASAVPSLTYTYKKWNIATQYDFDYSHTENLSEDITRIYPDHTLHTFPHSGTPEERFRTRSHSWWIDGDYDINKRHSISARYKLTSFHSGVVSDFMVSKTFANTAANTWRNELTTSSGKQQNHVATLYYRGNMGAWSLYSDLNLNWQKGDESYHFEELEDNNHIDTIHNLYHNTKFYTQWQITASRAIGKATINIGSNNSFTRYRTTGINTESMSKQWKNSIYATFSTPLCPTIRGSINGRAEQSTDIYDFKNTTQWTWNAGANLSYHSSNFKNFIDLAYNCNTQYPTQSDRNTVGFLTGYGVWCTGNPNLHRSLSHNINLSAHLSELMISGGLSIAPNAINYITAVNNSTGQLTQTPENISYIQPWAKCAYGINNINLTERLYAMLRASLGYSYMRYKQTDYSLLNTGQTWSGNIRAIFRYRCPDYSQIGFEASYYDDGHGHTVSPQGSQRRNMKHFLFYLSYSSSAFVASINYNLPIRTGSTHISHSETITPVYQAYFTRDLARADNHRVEISIYYRFAYGLRTQKKRNSQSYEVENNSMYR